MFHEALHENNYIDQLNRERHHTMSTTKLSPVVVSSIIEAGDAAFDGRRRRPVAAYTQDGVAVVCCRRTARKHGWTVVGRLF